MEKNQGVSLFHFGHGVFNCIANPILLMKDPEKLLSCFSDKKIMGIF